MTFLSLYLIEILQRIKVLFETMMDSGVDPEGTLHPGAFKNYLQEVLRSSDY